MLSAPRRRWRAPDRETGVLKLAGKLSGEQIAATENDDEPPPWRLACQFIVRDEDVVVRFWPREEPAVDARKSSCRQVFDEPSATGTRPGREVAQEGLHAAALAGRRRRRRCAFDGAKIALQPITDVAHLVHGPIACEGNSWDNRAASSGPTMYRTGFTTDVGELRRDHGGEKRLFRRSARSSRRSTRRRSSSTRPA